MIKCQRVNPNSLMSSCCNAFGKSLKLYSKIHVHFSGSSHSEDSDAESKNVHSKRLESPGLGDGNDNTTVASDAEQKGMV